MDDRELQQLLRMAREAEELADSAIPVSIPFRPLWKRPGTWAALSTLAAAAAVAIVWVVVPPAPPSVVTPEPGPLAVLPHHEEPTPEVATQDDDPAPVRIVRSEPGDEPEQSVVFAIFRDPTGGCSCVQMENADWGSKRLADVGRNELLAAALDDPCTTMARQVLIVGVSGKRGTVPATHDDAERLAARLASVPINEHQDVSLAAYAAMPELPIGSTVVAEAVSFFRR
jgi:hypothetical protein